MQLTLDLYYTRNADMAYMSYTQYKRFKECESSAMALLRGEWHEETTTAMLVGSYVDAYFSGDSEAFGKTHPELFKKDGTLKAEFVHANAIIDRIRRDPMMLQYLSGQHQVIMTGQIGGVPFKIRMDSYHPGSVIVDGKVMRDFQPIWKDGTKMHWIEAWGYDIQGAIYREIERQNQTGKRKDALPFVIAAATKEDEPDISLLSVSDERLKDRLRLVEYDAVRFWKIKRGEAEPTRCEKCDWCKKTKIITSVLDYSMEDIYE